MELSGVGVICAVAMGALAPPESFAKGRGFPLGAVSRQGRALTEAKTRLSGTLKMGQRDLRRLLFWGAMTVVPAAKMSSLLWNRLFDKQKFK